MAPPCPPPELMEDLVAEILLRLPPEQSACLVRASLVSKPWRRLLSDREFLRRYRASQFPRFVPTTSIPPLPQPAADWTRAWALDSRHGRVLLLTWRRRLGENLVVWEPATSNWKELPKIDVGPNLSAGAVLCAVDGCHHLDCHGNPFRVVVVVSGPTGTVIWAYLYSSVTNAWSKPASLHSGMDCYIKYMERSTIIGDEIYFDMYNKILKYDLGKHCLSVMVDMPDDSWGNVHMLLEDGSLGLAGIRGSRLHLWSRKANPEGIDRWVQYRVIKLSKTIPINENLGQAARVIGFAEGVNIIFVTNGVGTFQVQINSGQVRKVDDHGSHASEDLLISNALHNSTT
ncbi:hypothetical protein EJB05_14241, partial [Eragrostis curvula]